MAGVSTSMKEEVSDSVETSNATKDEGVALPAAAAQRDGPVFDAASPHLVQQCGDHARAGRAEGVAQGDGASVHVHGLLLGPQHPRGVHRDRGLPGTGGWDYVGIDTYEGGTAAAPGPRKPADRIYELRSYLTSRGYDHPIGVGEYNGFSATTIAAV